VALAQRELLTKPTVNFGCIWRSVGKNCCSAAVLASKLTKSLALSVRYLETKHLPNGLQNGGPPSPQALHVVPLVPPAFSVSCSAKMRREGLRRREPEPISLISDASFATKNLWSISDEI
jgi:hypothetical protein